MKYGSNAGEIVASIVFIIAFIALCIACAFMCPDSGHSHGHHVVVTGRPVPVHVRPPVIHNVPPHIRHRPNRCPNRFIHPPIFTFLAWQSCSNNATGNIRSS